MKKIFILFVFFSACSSQKTAVKKMTSDVLFLQKKTAELDSLFKATYLIFNNYERERIKRQFDGLPTSDVLDYLRTRKKD